MTVVSLLLDRYRVSNGGRLICHKRLSNSLFGKHFLGAARDDDGLVGGDRVEIAHCAGRVTAFAGSSRASGYRPDEIPVLHTGSTGSLAHAIDVGACWACRLI